MGLRHTTLFTVFILQIICFSSLTVLAQQYSINGNVDILVPNQDATAELLDADFPYTLATPGAPNQILLGFSKYTNSDLMIGVNFSYLANSLRYSEFDPNNSRQVHRLYSLRYGGLGIESKQVFPVLHRIFYGKLNISYYRLIQARRKTYVFNLSNSYDEDISIKHEKINKNIFNSFAEMGLQFPLLVRVKPIRIEGSIGLRFYQNYTSAFDFEDSIFVTPGIHFGITVIRL